MQKEKIIAWAQKKMLLADEAPLEPGYRWYHGCRVANLSLALAQQLGLNIDPDILYIGGLLHDVGKAGYRGDEPHGPRGARLLRQEIAHLFTPTELDRVAHIVANHYQRPKSKYMIGKIPPVFPDEVLLVQDADTIDHFGINGVWLTFHRATAQQQSQADIIHRHHSSDVAWHEEALNALNFELSQRELEHRLHLMHRLYAQWEREEAGELTHLS